MQEQQERPVTTAQEEQNQSEPRQPWQRPTLKRLQVNLNTAGNFGSGGDGLGEAST